MSSTGAKRTLFEANNRIAKLEAENARLKALLELKDSSLQSIQRKNKEISDLKIIIERLETFIVENTK